MNKETEYKEVNANLRHYSNLRFAQLTIFFALTGSIIGFFFKNIDVLKPPIKFFLEIAGLILSVLFWIMVESGRKKWMAFKRRGKELEKELGYNQLINSPRIIFFSATNATRMIFIGVIVFWLIVICT